MRLGVNACRIRTGGGLEHLRQLILHAHLLDCGFKGIDLWVLSETKRALPSDSRVRFHEISGAVSNSLSSALWERFILPRELRKSNCSVLLNVDAGSFSKFTPCVTISQDALPFDLREIRRYRWSLSALRLYSLRMLQKRRLAEAHAVIAQTDYHANELKKVCNVKSVVHRIPHGIDEMFKALTSDRGKGEDWQKELRCLTVTSAEPYKNSITILRGVDLLRQMGINAKLTILGSLEGFDSHRVRCQIDISNAESGSFVEARGLVSRDELLTALDSHDIFIFASSCESQSLTLLEAMSRAIPIVCSDKSSLPETLAEAGTYFNPHSAQSLASALMVLHSNRGHALRQGQAGRERAMAQSLRDSIQSSWDVVCSVTKEQLMEAK